MSSEMLIYIDIGFFRFELIGYFKILHIPVIDQDLSCFFGPN